MLSEERIVEIKNKHFVMDRYGENFNFIDFARAIETECVKVPEEMRMIPFDTESGESYRCGWNDCRKEMLEAAPQPAKAQASPLDLMECLQDRPVEPSKAVQGKCVTQAEKQESAYIALAFAETKEAPEDSQVSFAGPYTVYVVKNGAWEKQEPVKDAPVAYLAGMYRSVIEGKAENIPLGATISFINMGWKNQIELYTRPQPDLTAEVERLKGMVSEIQAARFVMNQHDQHVKRIAALEEAARRARDALQYKLHVVEAIAKLDGVLGNVAGKPTPD